MASPEGRYRATSAPMLIKSVFTGVCDFGGTGRIVVAAHQCQNDVLDCRGLIFMTDVFKFCNRLPGATLYLEI